MGISFSADPTAKGFFSPLRFEATLIDCEVDGEIPAGLNGSFYRSCIDRRYPPRFPDDTPYNADGAVDLFRFINGHVDFRSRYIQTPRLLAETAARRALFGRYRNRLTYDPAARNLSPNTGNTTPIIHHGRLFSCKEDSPPMALNPDTLETLGEWDFHGQMRAKTFTAHPKIDPNTGDMIAFSYEAKGDASPDLAVFVFDKHGKLKREWWLRVPVLSMMHDMAITDRHIILPTTGMVTSRERLDAGLIHWTYDSSVPCHVLIIPRDGDDQDIRWFHGTPEQAMLVHTTNARTEGSKVILDAPVASNNFHPFFPNADGSAFDVSGVSPNIRRWTFDLDSKDTGWKEEVLFGGLRGTSMVRMDDRYLTRPFRWSYMLVVDPTLPFDRERGGKLSVRVANAIFRFDHHTGAIDRLSAGSTHSLSEPQFVPARPEAPEGEGYILSVANDYAEMRSELVIADAMRLAEGPIARVKLPFRLHTQVHGWWEPEGGFLTGFRPR